MTEVGNDGLGGGVEDARTIGIRQPVTVPNAVDRKCDGLVNWPRVLDRQHDVAEERSEGGVVGAKADSSAEDGKLGR